MSDKVLKSKKLKQANKSSKPLLERQRRARINNSLNELKHLVLSSLYNGCPQAEQNGEKMEKAEILELTVNFLKLAKNRRHFGLGTAEYHRGKFLPSPQEPFYAARVESLTPHCRETVLPSRVQPIISTRVTPSSDSSTCCSVPSCSAYQLHSSTPYVTISPSVASHHETLPSPSFPITRPVGKAAVQVWRPW